MGQDESTTSPLKVCPILPTLNATAPVCFVDSSPGDMANEEVLVEQPAVRRLLEDGSAHRIVKVFHDPLSLTRALHGLGWSARVWPVRATLIAGLATPPGRRRA